jgi:ABC-type siderophore export system fused ATPase/permease subunit
VLVVTHDERYTHVADRVLKLEYGQLMSDVRSRVADPSIESACAEEMT